MNLLRQLKIGPRLGLAFGLVLLLLTVLTVVSLLRLSQLSATTRDISLSLYPKSNSSQRISYLVLDTARLVRNTILMTETERVDKARDAMAVNRSVIAEQIEAIDRLVDNDTGRRTLASIRASVGAYLAFSDDVATMAMKDKAAATELLYGERYKTQSDCLAALQAMVTFQEKRMVDGGKLAQAVYSDARTLILGTAIAAALVALGCAWAVSRSITAPLANAVVVAETVAAGDLTSHIVVDSPDEVGRLLGALKSMNDNLVGIVGSVRLTSDSIATGSSQIATGNADLSQRTEEQASNLQQTAASMEELSSTVKSNAETARTATQLAGSATDAATRGGRIVAQVVGTMEAISASSRKIADIIGVIDGIAFQTNILALNAAVEAARAGEQGRGFAVVASEVRTLAQRSAAAAKEIKGLITDSAEKVGAGNDQVGDAGQAMDEIVAQVRRVNDLIGEISSATAEQTQGIGQVGDAVNQLDKVTQQNAALVEESAAAAESLKHQAAKLVESVGVFKLRPGHRSA